MIFKPINKEEIQGRAEVFFRSERWKNTLVFLGFVLLASFFWALRYFNQKFEFEVPMKIKYTNLPAGIVLSDSLPQEMTFIIQDKGSVYLDYMIGRKKRDLFITIDLDAISLYKIYYVIDHSTLRNLIDEKLLATSQLRSFSPDRIEINYSQLAEKELPVIIEGTISPTSGYLFSDAVRVEPANLIVYGSQNALDSLQSIQTLPLEYEISDKNWTVFAGLQAPNGIRLSVDRVKISATIEEYTERKFEIPVTCSNVPLNRKVQFFPSVVELNVRVGLSRYAQLSKADFEIDFNYNDLLKKNTESCSLTLTRKPAWVGNYRIVPDLIEFLIEEK